MPEYMNIIALKNKKKNLKLEATKNTQNWLTS